MTIRNPVDASVGERLRRRRREIGLSQAQFGDQLNLTSQQILKYERGENRIAAGRLLEFAQILGVPIRYFFQDADRPLLGKENTHAIRDHDALMAFARSTEGRALHAAFTEIANLATRRRVIQLIQALSDEETADD
jgi:transcriptional regulator with XRE-family HTH domain